jgi:hypothetical protein
MLTIWNKTDYVQFSLVIENVHPGIRSSGSARAYTSMKGSTQEAFAAPRPFIRAELSDVDRRLISTNVNIVLGPAATGVALKKYLAL